MRRRQVSGQERREAPAGRDPADFSDMPFHDASGGKNDLVVNVNRVHQPPLDRFTDALNCDPMFQRHAKRNAGGNRGWLAVKRGSTQPHEYKELKFVHQAFLQINYLASAPAAFALVRKDKACCPSSLSTECD